jgi:uncharacterized protein YjgD (DUF1641 family)
MANPIPFIPKSTDPQLELQHRVAVAPLEHSEAILAAYDLLEEAHRQGILDALQGAMGARDVIAETVANYAAQPESVNAMRNMLALGKLLGAIDPDPLSRFSNEVYSAFETYKQEEKPPTLWQLLMRFRHADTRRGLSLLMAMLSGMGRANRGQS